MYIYGEESLSCFPGETKERVKTVEQGEESHRDEPMEKQERSRMSGRAENVCVVSEGVRLLHTGSHRKRQMLSPFFAR